MLKPIKYFRKNKKLLLAILGVLTIISFVFIPPILEIMGTMRGGRDPVVVKTEKYGNLRQSQIQSLEQQQHVLVGFLQEVQAKLMSLGVQPYGNNPLAGFLSTLASPNEESVVNTWLLAQRATQMGFQVNDEVINQFLANITEQKLSGDQLVEILRHRHLSTNKLFELLRHQLLAQQMQVLFMRSIDSLTPAQRWECYQQLHRRAKIEAVAFPAADYLAKTPEPTDQQLRDLFEKHKKNYHDPSSPTPGFREPQKIALQYFRADFEKFIDPSAIADSEVQEYYQKNKDKYRAPELPAEITPAKPADAKASTDKKDVTEKKDTAEKKPASEKKDSPEKKNAPKSEPAKVSSEMKAPAKAQEKPAETKAPAKAQEKPAETKAPAKAQEKPKTSSRSGNSVFRFASVTMEEKDAKKDDAKKDQKNEPKEVKKEAKEKANGKEAKQEKAVKPAADAVPPAPQTETKPQVKPEATAPKTADKKTVPPAPPKYMPLDDTLKGQIRRILAQERAGKKIRDVLTGLRDKMSTYQIERLNYEERKQKDKNAQPPAELDFEALAKANGLSAHQTGLLAAWELANLDIGKSQVEGGGRQADFARFAYSGLAKFQPAFSQDMMGNEFLFWKTDESAQRIPSFQDNGVREQVLQAWKLIEAGKLAKMEAEKTAGEVENAHKSLVDFFGKKATVLQPDPFSWLTFGYMPGSFYPRSPELSQIKEIDLAGEQFMKAVFALKAGGIGVAPNQPESVFYLVRVKEYSPSENVLWEGFVADRSGMYLEAARSSQRAAAQAWWDEMKAEVGFHWERDPNTPGHGAVAEE